MLTDAAEHGLPGEHHFVITFLSKAGGVKMSPRLLAQYPEEMTIILQHQFWDLAVSEDCFEVGLAFGGIPERLVVPFSAIKSFADPSAPFGLQFDPVATPGSEAEPGVDAAADTNAVKLVPARPGKLPAADHPALPAEPAEGDDVPAGPPGEKVVSLDSFRKKP